ncbi:MULTISPECIES: hypothetical protein [unclassified Sinorhizobium]|uniref:hypothetical protein n=1 Tax=unclassified Sinorhizobium TaxID=2613772 RepID=UPI0035262F95
MSDIPEDYIIPTSQIAGELRTIQGTFEKRDERLAAAVCRDGAQRLTEQSAEITKLKAEVERLTAKVGTYDEILRCVCGHLELPQSESGPADDLRLYDLALEMADVMYRETEAERVEHQNARYKAEAERDGLEKALEDAKRDVATIDAVRAALAPSFMTCVAGDGKPYLKLQFSTLDQAQFAHDMIIVAALASYRNGGAAQ